MIGNSVESHSRTRSGEFCPFSISISAMSLPAMKIIGWLSFSDFLVALAAIAEVVTRTPN
jgi:hypothetical protein